MSIGTPLKLYAKKVLLLGSGELGKEVAIELMRLGAEVIACDSYENAPAMQVAHRSHVFSMLDGASLRRVVEKEQPHLIVPEVEAIATEELLDLEAHGFKVIPTAKAAHFTMNRERIRRLAAEDLGLPTAKFQFADSFEELKTAAAKLGFPCVIKPIMSSSGKGQSVAKTPEDLDASWAYSQSGGRSGKGRIIVEEFVNFASEITLLTLRTAAGTTFCDPIGHIQQNGDYIESWQPHPMTQQQVELAQKIAQSITDEMGGMGIFGVELFLLNDGGVIFSEVSPRPHDTGMVTMATQNFSQFALHARAILGMPLLGVNRYCAGASVAWKSGESKLENPYYEGVEKVFETPGTDLRIFGKPEAKTSRRLGVVLASDTTHELALSKAKKVKESLKIRDANL